MMDATKYAPGYYPVPAGYDSWVKKDHIEKAPTWCSVDLRDGNQALIVPMSLEEKLEFFQMLVKIGFKEIEVGFPAASETEYEFLRTLIEKNMIPDDVTVQVLTQCRDHIIRRTFEAVKGAPRAVIHFYNSTSVAQREQVFHKSKEEIKQIAMDGAKLVKQLSEEYEGNFLFEYSPESFTGTEVDYAVEVCNAVLDIMQPTPDRPMIINLPVTVEMSMPHVYANQIEYCDKHLKYRDSVIISTHPHNDRGTGVACAELAVLAGAQRVECCLFGNGERTGNVDAVTLAMNMYSHGVDPKLDFSDMPAICATYERVTRMHIYERTKILKRPNFISPFIYKIYVRFYAKRDTRSALFRAMRVSLIFYPIRMRLRPRSAEPAAHTPRQGRRPPMHLPRSAGRTAHRHGPGIGCPETRWCRLLPVNERHSCPHRTGNRSPYPAAAPR